MKIIFLDIDGVLNNPSNFDNWPDASLSLIDPKCVKIFNTIIERTAAKIVISSSWRYQVHMGAMTVRGFELMLRSHGVRGEVIDVTCRDETIEDRGDQILHWVQSHPDIIKYVVIDDMGSDDMRKHPFIHTNGSIGLQQSDADKAVEILGEIFH